jgi:hypothetical protein
MSDTMKMFVTIGGLFGLLLLLICLSGCEEKEESYQPGNALIHDYPLSSYGDELYRIRKQMELMNRLAMERSYECAQAQANMEFENE